MEPAFDQPKDIPFMDELNLSAPSTHEVLINQHLTTLQDNFSQVHFALHELEAEEDSQATSHTKHLKN